MMATTHALFGVVLATATMGVAPEFAPVALVAGVAGSVFPDLDLYAGHRRTLHYPVYYAVGAVGAVGLAVAVPIAETVGFAVFLAGAAAHSLMDVFGGGLELRPWEAQSDRAVYDHYRGEWVPPRRWIRYDGAPEDLLVAAVFGAPAFVVWTAPTQTFVAAVLAVSAGYALLRKPLAALVERLVPHVPPSVRVHLPERFREESSGEMSRNEAGGDASASAADVSESSVPAPRAESGD
ncbi:metal-dependent hydrolase [Halorussus ruber]|uniref:metal-dependent hydrolase n=1 Tax=Halorussus ruber TaxID=1126238 RepID=UPI0034A3B511